MSLVQSRSLSLKPVYLSAYRSRQRKSSLLFITLFTALLFTVKPTPTHASTRWVWIKGIHQIGTCEAQKTALESAFTQHLIELAQVNLVYDGQALSCERADCARARLASAGGITALLGESACRRGKLRYTIKVISLVKSRKPLIYSRSLKTPTKSEASEAGRRLARRVLRGPRPPKKEDSSLLKRFWSVSLGLYWAQISPENTPGSQVSISTSQKLSPDSALDVYLGVVGSRLAHSELELSELGFDLGLSWSPIQTGLGPRLSGGFNLSSHHRAQIKRIVEPLDEQRQLWVSRRALEVVDGWNSALWLEAGWHWSTGRLQPHFILRYTPLRVSTDQTWAELSARFGFRW